MVLQTQPVPNPISYFMHQSPEIFHKFETLTNHFVELVAPWFLLGPRRLCMIGGAIQILFQVCVKVDRSIYPVLIAKKLECWPCSLCPKRGYLKGYQGFFLVFLKVIFEHFLHMLVDFISEKKCKFCVVSQKWKVHPDYWLHLF